MIRVQTTFYRERHTYLNKATPLNIMPMPPPIELRSVIPASSSISIGKAGIFSSAGVYCRGWGGGRIGVVGCGWSGDAAGVGRVAWRVCVGVLIIIRGPSFRGGSG